MTYLDYAATAPLVSEARAAMEPFIADAGYLFGNANSLHQTGRDAFALLEDLRVSLARTLGARRPDEIVFTSGATESDNAALIGIALGMREERRLAGRATSGRVVMSRIAIGCCAPSVSMCPSSITTPPAAFLPKPSSASWTMTSCWSAS